jgi:hypothetical protein
LASRRPIIHLGLPPQQRPAFAAGDQGPLQPANHRSPKTVSIPLLALHSRTLWAHALQRLSPTCRLRLAIRGHACCRQMTRPRDTISESFCARGVWPNWQWPSWPSQTVHEGCKNVNKTSEEARTPLERTRWQRRNSIWQRYVAAHCTLHTSAKRVIPFPGRKPTATNVVKNFPTMPVATFRRAHLLAKGPRQKRRV